MLKTSENTDDARKRHVKFSKSTSVNKFSDVRTVPCNYNCSHHNKAVQID